jgi:hypothetical protein
MLELLEQVRMVTEERRDLKKKKIIVSALVLAYIHTSISLNTWLEAQGRQAG